MKPYPLGLLQGLGIELEYMIVDRESLDVRPIADRLIEAATGKLENSVEGESIDWSNELTLHVIELKTHGPVPTLSGQAPLFQQDIERIDGLLEPLGARLMPGAMHPWMDPHREMRLWPHEDGPIYRAFDRIFGCTGHGWANLQSTHINLAFGTAEEFGRLHAATRLVLSFLPALAASSPVMDARVTGLLDNRLDVYRTNAIRVPSISGLVIPEAVFTPEDYESVILQQIYDDLAPHDPEGVLRYEWANARGCIARFDRGAIEIRVLDIQEYPAADLAVAALVVETVRALCEERWSPYADQRRPSAQRLAPLFRSTLAHGERAKIDDEEVLALFGVEGAVSAGEFWRHVRRQLEADGVDFAEWEAPLDVILEEGSLARRLVLALGKDPDRKRLEGVYRDLSDCLVEARSFDPAAHP